MSDIDRQNQLIHDDECRKIGQSLVDACTSRFQSDKTGTEEAFAFVISLKQFMDVAVEAARKDAKHDDGFEYERKIREMKLAMRHALQKASLARPEPVITFRELSEILKPFCE